MPPPLLTVILPTLNAASVLPGCLESLVPFGRSGLLEVLVMDGGSRDGTPALAESFIPRLPGLRVVVGRDAGIYDAMNKGMDRAAGRWMYFLGADDRWFDAQRMGVLLGGVAEDVDVFQVNSRKRTGQGDSARTIGPGRLLAGEDFNHQALFYRRSFVADLRYSLDYPLAADQLFNLQLVAGRGARVLHVPEVLVDYANTGISAQRKDDRWASDKKAWLERIFSPEAVARRERWRPWERWAKRISRLVAGRKVSQRVVERMRDALYGPSQR